MKTSFRERFRIGECQIDALTGQISGPQGVARVQPKVVDVLICLAERAGELIERDELLREVWGRPTSDEVLTRCISELRRAFGDERGSPAYIQTVSKRGYRLLQPVERGAAAAVPSVPERTLVERPPATATAVSSIAVLPFDYNAPDETRAFIAQALASELHNSLARVDRLRVASRRACAKVDPAEDVRGVGRELDVDYVLSGSVHVSGQRLRVIAELARTEDGTQIWSGSYDRAIEDIMKVEREIADAIVSAFTTQHLREQLHKARHTASERLDVWGLVQQARALVLEYTPEGLSKAVEPLKRAIELDSQCAIAHAMLASVLVERLVNGLSDAVEEDERAAHEAAEKAYALAPDDPLMLKLVSLVWAYEGERLRALACLRKAVALTPFDLGAWGYMGWPLTASPDPRDLKYLHGVLDQLLDMAADHPGAAFWHYHKSVAAALQDDFATARRHAERALELRPRLSLAWIHYTHVLGCLGLRSEAKAAFARCVEVNPAMTPAHYERLLRRILDDEAMIDRRLRGLDALEPRNRGGDKRKRPQRSSPATRR